MTRHMATIDGNEAAAYVAYKTNEVVAIYPITPASPMGELADAWSVQRVQNIWGAVPQVVEMQAEGGAAGAVHGALQTGALTTTFTASQGLLLMIPNMYKIAGELTPTVFHIAARSVAAQALSIFCDHGDVMAVRGTGWGMLFSNSVQEVMDLALISQAAALEARLPFLHVFDGFRTSHELQKIERLAEDDMLAMIDEERVRDHRERALSPDRPFIRGTAQNPDVFFQAREAANPYYDEAPAVVQRAMDRFAARVGRRYRLFDYVGAPDAERVLVLMGSAAEAAAEAVRFLEEAGEKVGIVKVRLYRPFSGRDLMSALPQTVRAIAALDRTKEPGATGEPLYQDVLTAVSEGLADGTAPFTAPPRVVGGRYGLSSKEFTPAMAKAALDQLAEERPKNHFTVGIRDDRTHTSLEFDPHFSTEAEDVVRAVFWGLGADGTVSANKNSIKIIGEETPNYAQGYFVYDSRKAGARTISHLRFGPRPIRSTYQIQRANFVGVHQWGFIERYNLYRPLEAAGQKATLLLNSPIGPEEVWGHLPPPVQEAIIGKALTFYVIDAYSVAEEAGLGARINTIMQTCFFALTDILPAQEAIAKIKEGIRKTYGVHGKAVVRKNFAAVDAALDHLHEVEVPREVTSEVQVPPVVPDEAPAFVREVTAEMIAGRGDFLPVSALPDDGTYPSATTRWERRNLALEVPVWEPDLCIQCGKCVLVCPHAVIRAKVVHEPDLAAAPEGFEHASARWRGLEDRRYTLQVSVEDCTGCTLCVEVCPAKDKGQVGRKALNMAPQRPLRDTGREHWEYFLGLPEVPRSDSLAFSTVKDIQLLQPLFEFSGACSGCGETPYLKLLSQLFGDRALVANATGCSSIYGGNLPVTPWSINKEGRGPAWNNSLFEDNAEFGFGYRLTLDQHGEQARELVRRLRLVIGSRLADGLLMSDQSDEAGIAVQRQRVTSLRVKLAAQEDPEARRLVDLAPALVRRSVWIVGGDGWAYDIGYGGLDHVLASGRDVNVLVLDTEVYSNTGGQASKATPLAAAAKFAMGGKPTPKKDLGMMAITYGSVYVAQVAMGASDAQTVRAFLEAEAYPGPSLVIAYCPCIAHGIDMAKGMDQMKLAVDSGHWPLYRYDPRRETDGKNPFQLDSRDPRIPLQDYIYTENRYRLLKHADPRAAARLLAAAQEAVDRRWRRYRKMAAMTGEPAVESA